MRFPPLLRPAELYRLLHTGNPGDEEFYARAAVGASRILELGVGWGRIALGLCRAGHHVVGVDTEAEFVHEAETTLARGPTGAGSLRLVQADLRSLELGETFDRVFIAYNTLYSLGGKARVTEALRRAKAHLEPDGEIWFDVYAMDEFHWSATRGQAEGDDESRDEVLRTERNGQSLLVFESTKLDLASQRLDVRYEAELDGLPAGSALLTHHYLLTQEILDCLQDAGLEAAALLGGFSGQPANEEAEHTIVCAVPSEP